MRERPDLSFPLAPDVESDVVAARQRTTPVSQGGTSLRPEGSDDVRDFEWPEAGPSGLLIEEKEKAKALGPFGAKAVASMTGAVVVSLLSKLPECMDQALKADMFSDTVRCSQNEITDGPTAAQTLKFPYAITVRRLLPDIPPITAETDSDKSLNMLHLGGHCRPGIPNLDPSTAKRRYSLLRPSSSDHASCTAQWLLTSLEMGWDMGRSSHTGGGFRKGSGEDEWSGRWHAGCTARFGAVERSHGRILGRDCDCTPRDGGKGIVEGRGNYHVSVACVVESDEHI